MSLVDLLTTLGGFGSYAELSRAHTRAELQRALAAGEIVRCGRGRYTLPEADEAVRLAHQYAGVVCLTSAALHHGWEVRLVPARHHLAFPKHRRLPEGLRSVVSAHWLDPGPDDVVDRVTSPDKTLEMCLRSLPDGDALAVADSALRHGYSHARLVALARDARGPGSNRMRWLAQRADGRAANGFESALRAICLQVSGLSVRPQLPISGHGLRARPDLVDEDLRIVIEADSFEWHGHREGLVRDCARYNAMVANGWLVLRFTWEDVIFHAEEVRQILQRLVDRVSAARC